MKLIRQFALFIEAIIGFGLPIYIWALGLIMSPLLAVGFIMGGGVGMGASVVAILLGGIGLWGMFQLTVKVIDPRSRIAAPRRLLGCVACGLLAVFLAAIILGLDLKDFSLIFLPSMIVAAHFLYLARGYMWKSS